jgi:hypothetical protein
MVERVLRCSDFLHGNNNVEHKVCYLLVCSVFCQALFMLMAEVNTSDGGTAH